MTTSLSAFDFDLPAELIAQVPRTPRDQARLFGLQRSSDVYTHGRITDLTSFLMPGDVLVVNDTRVYSARLLGRRFPSGGSVECLLLARLDSDRWEVLLHPGNRLKEGELVIFEKGSYKLELEVLSKHFLGKRTVRLSTINDSDIFEAIDAIGHVPLPPYIKRADGEADLSRYQTVYARVRGSVAAPTAGLHFTPTLLEEIEKKGVVITAVTLHVGYGTFQPIRTQNIEDHSVGAEVFDVTQEAADLINAALDEGRRVVAVGTTTTRVLETLAMRGDGRVFSGRGKTDLYIRPGVSFMVVDALLTNFHLPRSSLLVLASAFAGRERLLSAYQEAIVLGYRFYSYGDAMFIS